MRRHNKDSNTAAKVWMSIFIGLIMVLSVFGIIIGSQSSELRYGNIKFKVDDTGSSYIARLNNQDVQFYTLPGETANFNITNATSDVMKKALFIVATFNPNEANESAQAIELARLDLSTVLKDKQVFNAVTEPSDLYVDAPLIGCENATGEVPVILFNVSDMPSVVQDGYCTYLNGRGTDFLRLRDALLYKYFGVMDGPAG